MLKTSKGKETHLNILEGTGLFTLVDIGSIFFTSVQSIPTYIYQVFLAQNLKFFDIQTRLGFTIHTERHQFY